MAFIHSLNNMEVKKFTTEQVFENQIRKITQTINSFGEVIEAITIAAPGPADYEKGEFGHLTNIPLWEKHNIIEELKASTGVKNIICQNDANLMALAHHHHFKNQNGITQFFTISTGFGAGLVIDNKIFLGAYGYAQEIAMLPTSFNPEKGAGFGEGSLEYFASGAGIAKRSGLPTHEAFKQYETNEKAKIVIDEAIETLANTIAVFVAIINPSLLVFDGSVARNNKWYVEKAIEKAKQRAWPIQFKNLRFEFAQLEDDAALLGAYFNALNNLA